MCGLVGFITNQKLDQSQLKKMADTIAYRGPDYEGYYLDNYAQDYQIGLAHKRLAIIDLTAAAHQPMIDQNVIVVFNGEIYNFQQLRQELQVLGYQFKSNSDTEVVIKAYRQWGIDCLSRFNGMFAMAIYDRQTADLFLVRDRLGVKPLYYYLDGDQLVFASELKPLMNYSSFIKELDLDALSLYLFHGYITAPKTIFKNTYKLEPGKILHFNKGKVCFQTYWSIEQQFRDRQIANKTENQWLEQLDSLLKDSITQRMISDVNLGAFLSGGIDSSLIVAVMQSLSNRPVKTFTIGFEEEQFNEADHAAKVAKYLGTQHHELYLPIKEAEKLIPEIAKYYDEPFADSSQLPTMLVSQLARQQVTVALSGDGGDELFCGYGRYQSILNLQKMILWAKIAKSIPFLKQAIKWLTSNSKYLEFFELTNDNNVVNSAYLNYLHNFRLLKDYQAHFDNRYLDIMGLTDNIQEKHMLQDLLTYLPDDILTKVDRASMRVSLEARAPLLDDYRFLEFSFNLPHEYKFRNGEQKYLLKRLLYRYVPAQILERPKKGFAVPIFDWLRTDLKFLLTDYLGRDYLIRQGLFEVGTVQKLVGDFLNYNGNKMIPQKISQKFKLYKDGYVERTIWQLLVFQLWYDCYMRG